MSRAEQALAFCSALLGGPDGDERLSGLYTTVWDSADKRTRWRRADQPGAVASLITGLDEQPSAQAVYIGVGLASQVRHNKVHDTDDDGTVVTDQRPRREDIDGLLGLWADIDIAGEGHADAHYPQTIDEARRIVDALRLKPTLTVHSGGGLQVWWMFTEPWLVADSDDLDAERAKMATLARDWTRTVQYQAELIGRYKVDSVFDLARLLRPAGSTNRKIDGSPRRVEILEFNEGATYDAFDFEDHLADPSVIAAYAAKAGTSLSGLALSEAETAVLREVNFAAVWARVNSAAYRALDYTPPWLADILELEAELDTELKITKVWTGDRPDLKEDQNRFDAALTRLLAAFPSVDTEGLVEALMCRRLRLVDGSKADKVDPRRRLDYVARTVARFRAEAAKDEQLKVRSDQAVDDFASVTLTTPAHPEPVLSEVELDRRGRVVDQDEAKNAFFEYADELITDRPPTPAQQARVAEAVVVAEATGAEPVYLPDEVVFDPFAVYGERSEREIEALDTLTELLLPKAYRERGISVYAIEYRDYGDQQKGRVLLRIPADFDWPTDRPSRYRPGRPLPTEWWNRTLFESSKGFKTSVERDCKIITREDASKKDWAAIIRTLIPLWRKDSSGGDLGNNAHEWLYSYLMLHHGSGVENEVLASGRPWVRKTNGWTPETPPVIYVDQTQFLAHCATQPGGVSGRGARAVLEFLKMVQRRPRVRASGSMRRPTWYEIEPEQFGTGEWQSIIDVTRSSYERSMTGKAVRAVEDERGIGINEGPRKAAR
jgi:hypothetical protein